MRYLEVSVNHLIFTLPGRSEDQTIESIISFQDN